MSTRSTSLLAVILAALSWPGAPTVALQQAPRFRASVEAVVLDVSVLGRDGLPVRGLDARDFTVLEDGTPQSIATFTPIDLPDVERAVPGWLRDAPRDTAANDEVTQGAVLVILMDDIAVRTLPSRVQACARQVIESMGPHDVAAVVYLASKYLGQAFTSDRSRLLAAVERFMGGGGTRGWNSRHAYSPTPSTTWQTDSPRFLLGGRRSSTSRAGCHSTSRGECPTRPTGWRLTGPMTTAARFTASFACLTAHAAPTSACTAWTHRV